MKRVVVDASALADYLLRSPRGLEFDSLIEDREHDLHAPALCDLEVTAVLRRGLLSGRLDGERAVGLLGDLRDLPLTRHGHLGLLARILALRGNFSVYDAAYVALAERLEAQLLTGDRRLGRAVAEHTEVRVLEA